MRNIKDLFLVHIVVSIPTRMWSTWPLRTAASGSAVRPFAVDSATRRKTTLFAVAVALAATVCLGVWAASPTNTPVTPSMTQRIEPFQHMKNAKGLATAEFYDHGFVFH